MAECPVSGVGFLERMVIREVWKGGRRRASLKTGEQCNRWRSDGEKGGVWGGDSYEQTLERM